MRRMQVWLSVPYSMGPPFVPGSSAPTLFSNRLFTICYGSTLPAFFCLCISSLIDSMRIRFGYFSNIPSHPISINSYFWEDISTENTSGLAVIACFSGGNDLFCLNLKSPNALVRLRHPSTLPPQTFDPELIILPYSSGTSGE